MTKTNKKYMTPGVWLLILLLLAMVSAGTVLARYMAMQEEQADTKSQNFHISSDYLDVSSAAYEIPLSDTLEISFLIYNYEKLNSSLVTEGDIQYKISVSSDCAVTVKNKTGNTVEAVDGTYTLDGDAGKTWHAVTINCSAIMAGSTLDVSVETVYPYAEKLSASFTLTGHSEPQYRIEDKGNYVLVALYSNNYSGAVTVTWTADFSPDNTHPLMQDWVDTAPMQIIGVTPNTTYELIFYKNTSVTYSKSMTAGKTVDVGS